MSRDYWTYWVEIVGDPKEAKRVNPFEGCDEGRVIFKILLNDGKGASGSPFMSALFSTRHL